jgi:lipid-A-disaccharide synthase
VSAAGRAPRIFLIAGEESGDRLGAALIAALRQATGGEILISGIGGSHMAALGVETPFPLGDLAIIGFSSIPSKLPLVLRRIRESADAVIATKPDILVIIDSPDFTHRVARRVRGRMPSMPIVDYVCPSVWAWRPGRARKMTAYVDLVLALLPFEPAAMQKLGGPRTLYVGHPLADQVARLRPSAVEEERRRASPPMVIVMPGSRTGEVRRMSAVFGEAVARLSENVGPLEVVVPTVPRLAELVKRTVSSWRIPTRVVDTAEEKNAAFRNARLALAKSGTSTLELAIAGVPMVAAYSVSFPEALIAQVFITVSSVILANLVIGENVIPELLQFDCTPDKLARALERLIGDTPERRRQIEAFARLDEIMQVGRESPSARAAAFVLEMAGKVAGGPARLGPSAKA